MGDPISYADKPNRDFSLSVKKLRTYLQKIKKKTLSCTFERLCNPITGAIVKFWTFSYLW